MKISLNWLKQYVSVDLTTEQIADALTDLGLEVEGVAAYERIKGSLQGLVVGEVRSCQRHPNADRLSLTTVDVGGAALLNIVCGAPNVAAGQKVVVAVEGTRLYPAGGESFVIKKGKIRGEVSEGMICSEDEIGLGKSHEGILVLDPSALPGTPASEYFAQELYSDTVFEIGLTPNRSDATGHVGVAFDLAAYLQVHYPGQQGRFGRPQVQPLPLPEAALPIEVVVENAEACPRYTGVVVSGVQVSDSPLWLQNYLLAIGQTPINNIVDITNYVLHELGQPLHAFDYDAIAGNTVRVKNLPDKTPFVTLDGINRSLHAEDLMICDGNSQPLCMAGVFGGRDSGVHAGTKTVFLESAYFKGTGIRRSSMRHQLRTEAATRFEKGTDPNATLYALQRAVALILETAGGKVASRLIDCYPEPVQRPQVRLRYAQVERLLGIRLEPSELHRILDLLDMPRTAQDEQSLTVAVPTNKADVLREVDVLEEVLRVYGYNRVENPKELRSVLSPSARPDRRALLDSVADMLSANGFSEMMSTSMTRSEYYQKYLPIYAPESLVLVHNTANKHLDLMRPDMLFGVLEAVAYNQNRQNGDLMLYELGKTYLAQGGAYQEQEHLCLAVVGQRFAENRFYPKRGEAGFFTLKAFVEMVLQRLGLAAQSLQSTRLEAQLPWAYALQYSQGKTPLVAFGQIAPELQTALDIRSSVFYADFYCEALVQAAARCNLRSQPLPKYPSMRRDLAMVLDTSVPFEQIVEIARHKGKNLLRQTNLFDVYENEQQLGKGKKSYAVSFLFRDDNKTLQDQDIDRIMQELMKQYEEKLGAVIRKN